MTETVIEKTERKLRFLEDAVSQLERYRQLPRQEYDSDSRNALAVERLFQIALEAMVDTARLIIIEQRLEKPQETRSEFAILAGAEIIPDALARRLTEAKRFRNVLVHEYVAVEREQVYRNLQEGLTDLKRYAQKVARYLLSEA